MFLNLVLRVIFMVSSSVLTLKTRHFPKNYNESKYIANTLYVTCVAWTLFIPGYFFFFFFCIIWENGIMEGILDLNCIRFNWIHHVAWFVWTQAKVTFVQFERRVGSEVR